MNYFRGMSTVLCMETNDHCGSVERGQGYSNSKENILIARVFFSILIFLHLKSYRSSSLTSFFSYRIFVHEHLLKWQRSSGRTHSCRTETWFGKFFIFHYPNFKFRVTKIDNILVYRSDRDVPARTTQSRKTKRNIRWPCRYVGPTKETRHGFRHRVILLGCMKT